MVLVSVVRVVESQFEYLLMDVSWIVHDDSLSLLPSTLVDTKKTPRCFIEEVWKSS